MRYRRLIILLLLLLVALCLFLWLRTGGGLSDFGLNAFTETFGILVTVFIVDHLLRRQEETRSLPQKAAAYEDVRLLISRVVTFWSDAYKQSVFESMPETLETFFCDETFYKIRCRLNLDGKPPVLPERTWWDWLPECLTDHKNQAETILERHNYILDPVAYSLVHQLATEGMNPSQIKSIRQIYAQTDRPRVTALGAYYFLFENYYESVLGLVAWCKEQAVLLQRNGLQDLRAVTSTLGPWEPTEPPPSMISNEELGKQEDAVRALTDARSAASREPTQKSSAADRYVVANSPYDGGK